MAGKSDFTVPFIISAVLHIGVIAILAMGVDFQDKPKLPTPQAQSAPVQAVVVEQQKVDDYVQKLKQDKAAAERRERERQQELDRQANEAKKAREQEQQRIRKLEAERKQKELETRKAADAAKAAKLKEQQEKEKAQKAEAERKAKEQQRKEAEEAALKAEQKRKAEEAAAKKAEEERKRKEAERKAKEEAERKRKAEEEARRRQEQELADALAAEQAALSATRNRQVMSEVDRYRAMITATIQRNLVVDESMRGRVCKVKVRLAKDGFVTNSQIIEGDPVVCRAAKAAINKAGRLPVSQEPDVYQLMKEINLEVRPEFN
ncbi:cell envelope integrity protein TolA [Shewanella chilikensis]|uniref:cell envelope integrity protein TolA n=1 Tax=Shewanella chilikensis TaxID=558541 RepID=UPI001F1EEDA1|nr:cell envelope integrity protein TolA [Shewanella chilikensis]MCE9789443.1 cell envelope integrity protein TolA [Shewanella chilikensis]